MVVGHTDALEADYFKSSTSMALMRFFKTSKDEKKTALTAHDRAIETPRPRYMLRRNHWIFTGSTFSPLEYVRELRW